MFLKSVSQAVPLTISFLFAFVSGDTSVAKSIAWLSFYIATGPVFYYMLNGVVGRKRETVFGVEGKEIGPYAGIKVPNKVLILIIFGVATCWLLAIVFHQYGI